MKQLIWFSVPGAFLVFAFVVTYPGSVGPHAVAALIAGTPVIGFLLHQGFRVVFELCKGFESQHRSVLNQIADDFGLQGKDRLRQAFEIWEITFYGKDFPPAFRDHDRGAWHYILSFWSGALAGPIGLILLAVLTCWYDSHVRLAIFTVAPLSVSVVILALKGYQTYRSLVAQELAAYKANYKHFKCVADSRADYKSGCDGRNSS